jgi:hypothetical protein
MERTAVAAVLDGGDDLLELLLDIGEGFPVGQGLEPGPIFGLKGDRARADAGGERMEDAADDLDLRLVDGALAADRLTLGVGVFHHVITVAETAAGLALLEPAADTAMRLGVARQSE